MHAAFIHIHRMSIGARILAARKAKGWSQEKLADAIGQAQTTVSSWERSRTEPRREDVVRIASKLQIPLAEIEDVLRDPPRGPKTRTIPVLSWVSAGLVSDVGAMEAVEAEEEVTVADLPAGEYFATNVKGDSMDRVSPEGSRIIVNVSDKRLVAGRAYIFSVRGETTYKIYQPEPVPRLEPFSTNPANKTIFLDKRGTWFVVGRVLRSYIDLH
jgi:SOS-response transcriptional repressor LexA